MPRRSLEEMGMASLAEIAVRLNISASTVSRALRDLKGVHPETKARVMKVAQELGYGGVKPQSVSIEEIRTVLTLVQASGSSRVMDYLNGLSEGAVEHNCSMLTHYLPFDRCADILDPAKQPPALRMGQVSGIILLCKWQDEVVEQLSKIVPVVSVIHQYRSRVDRIGIDNESGMHAIVKHLKELGHEKIGFFGLCPEVSWSRSRYGAFVEAMAANGLGFGSDYVFQISSKEALSEGLFDPSPYVAEVADLIDQGVRAWVTPGEQPCYSLMSALHARGIRVPEDVSVTGFHGPFRVGDLPQATSVSVSSEELGLAGMRRLMRRIESPDESVRTILLPCELVEGESAAS